MLRTGQDVRERSLGRVAPRPKALALTAAALTGPPAEVREPLRPSSRDRRTGTLDSGVRPSHLEARERPATADGHGAHERPALGSRRISSSAS